MSDVASLTVEQVPSRRDFLHALAAVGTVLVAGRLGTLDVFAQDAAAAGAVINAYVAIAPSGKVTLQCAHSEMGQGITTTFAAVIADELEADWSQCEVVYSPAAPAYRHPVYNWQFTGNAESIRSYHALIRKMGAAAREMLIAAAAVRLQVPAAELVARSGTVQHPPSGRWVGYGPIAQEAAQQPVPASPRVKPESEWRLVGGGRSLPRRDVPAKVEGSAVFGIDVKVARMAHAAVMSAPTIATKIDSVDDAAARKMPGVLAVVPLDGVVAVVAEHYWQARLALEQLKVSWRATAAPLDDAALEATYRAAFDKSTGWAQAETHGDSAAALAAAKHLVEVGYFSPWLSHAPMEPMNATVSVTDAGVEVWAPRACR